MTNGNFRAFFLTLGVVFIVTAWPDSARAAGPSWSPAPKFPGGGADTAILLTDGTIMVHDNCSPNWYRLTPDNTGSYLTGSWSVAIPMQPSYGPLYFASAVLADGRLVVTGGEYNIGSSCNTGTSVDTNLAAIYNPATNAWSPLTSPPFPNVGDSQSVVLPTAPFKLQIANLNNTQIATLDPGSLTWSAAITPPGKADSNSEEGWNLLPNGTILTVDTQDGTNSEIFNPTSGTWSSAGSTIATLTNAGGMNIVPEMGPAVLRPDGTVYATGASGQNAVYNTLTGNWAASLSFPIINRTQQEVPDGPASLLPDGNVLVATSGFFTQPTNFFEFDGTNLTQEPATPNAPNIASFQGRMLLLPTGQVLFTDGSTDVELYNPLGTFQNSWRPTITTAPPSIAPGMTYSISGTQFNGLSQAVAYGDDAQAATNYPLVRITNTGTGHVFYARTHGHSSMAVATGATIVSTNFDAPSGLEAGPSTLVVVANSIPSLPVNVQVGVAPTISKTFAPSSIPQGTTTTLSFTVTNPNPSGGATLNNVAFTDTLPAGLTTTGSVSGSCGGGTITVLSTSISLGGATLAANASCTFSITVTATTAGVDTNVTGSVSGSGLTGNQATAVLTVIAPPSISKTFVPGSIPLGTNSSLTFTIVNPNAGTTLTGIGFADTLPSGLTAIGVVGTCGGGIIVTGPPISLTGATLAGGGSCTFSVTVTGATAGVKNNVTSNVTSNEGGTGKQAMATLLVVAPPVISKAFTAPKILPGGTTAVTFSITNPNSFVGLTGVGFTDSLPSGLTVANPNGLSSTCGGTATATVGSGTISLTGGVIASSGSCTVTANVTAPEGIYVNSVQVTSTNGGTGNPSSATLFVATPPNLSKVFGEVSIGPGSSTTLSFTLMNPNHVVTLHALQFSDMLPAGLVISTPNGLTGTCGGGTILAPAGSNLITVGSAVLAFQASCTFSVNVTSDGTVLGYLTNTTSTVTSTEALPGAAASATIFIGDPFQVSYAANLNIGESYIDIANTGTNGAPLLGPGLGAASGNICVNVYAFDPAEELISCCSCLITPDQTVNLGVNRDLTAKTLTGVVPASVTVKLLVTLAGSGGTGTSCTNTAASATGATLANGGAAWGTTLHATPTAGSYATTERAFTGATLSAGELASISGRCAAVIGNGSGFGVCSSCKSGALGASNLPQ